MTDYIFVSVPWCEYLPSGEASHQRVEGVVYVPCELLCSGHVCPFLWQELAPQLEKSDLVEEHQCPWPKRCLLYLATRLE